MINNITDFGDNASSKWILEDFQEESLIVYVQLIINALGVVGNVLVVVAYYMGDMYMVSVNDFVLSLAYADLLAAILLLPIPKFITMPTDFLGHLYCTFIYQGTLLWVCIKSSVFFIMAISLECAAAVRKPWLYKKIFCHKPYRRLISVSIWIISFASNLHRYITDKVSADGRCNSTLVSQATLETPTAAYKADVIMVSLYVYSITYIIPLLVMITAYALTAARLRKNVGKMSRRNSILVRARYRVIGVVLIDIIVFIICLTPNQLMYLITCFGKDLDVAILKKVLKFDHILLSIYVCANPIIYTATNPQFRLTLKSICCGAQGKRKDSYRITSMQGETSLDLRTCNGDPF